MKNFPKLMTTHGKKMLLGTVCIINGKVSIAYIKNDIVLGYIHCDEIFQQMSQQLPDLTEQM